MDLTLMDRGLQIEIESYIEEKVALDVYEDLFDELVKIAEENKNKPVQLKHILIAGHSGSGKSTLANQLAKDTGYPIVHLDDDPEIQKWWSGNRDNEYISPAAKDFERFDKLKRKVVIDTVNKLKAPSIIEGTQVTAAPEVWSRHRRIFVDTPQQTVVRQRLARDRKRGEYGLMLPGSSVARMRAAIAKKIMRTLEPEMESFRSFPGTELMRPSMLNKEAFIKFASDEKVITIAVDLDGTLAEKIEPYDQTKIGAPIEENIKLIRKLKDKGARIIIWTVRGDKKLIAKFAKESDLPYDYINENPDQPPGSSGKIIADLYIDDRVIHIDDLEKAIEKAEKRVKLAA